MQYCTIQIRTTQGKFRSARGWIQRKAAKNAELAKGVSASRDHESRRGRESPGDDWRRVPFPSLRASSRPKRKLAPTLRVPRPAGHETPPAAGHENDRFAVCTKRMVPHHFNTKSAAGGATALHGALGQYLQPLFRVGRRPFRVPAKRGFRVRQAMGLKESRRDGAAKGGVASRPPPLPTRTGAAGPSRRRFSWSRAAPRHGEVSVSLPLCVKIPPGKRAAGFLAQRPRSYSPHAGKTSVSAESAPSDSAMQTTAPVPRGSGALSRKRNDAVIANFGVPVFLISIGCRCPSRQILQLP